jgi:hypothetical protein
MRSDYLDTWGDSFRTLCGGRQQVCLSLRVSLAVSPTVPPSRCRAHGVHSGTLRDTHHGAAIDAADVVVRFNGGRASGFEAHVGHRSDVRLYNGPYVEPKMSGEATVAQVPPLSVILRWY